MGQDFAHCLSRATEDALTYYERNIWFQRDKMTCVNSKNSQQRRFTQRDKRADERRLIIGCIDETADDSMEETTESRKK